MDLCRHLFLLACCLLTVDLVSSNAGPVFINPASQTVPVLAKQQENYVTQTVYGFLDFTTTIGNTIMVFSPQSVPAAPVEQEKPVISNTIIETKPVVEVKKDVIKPSKTLLSNEKKTSEEKKIVSSVVQVHTNAPSSKIEVKALPSSKVNVINVKSSVLNTVSSKVQSIKAQQPSPPSSASKKASPASSASNILTKIEVVSNEKIQPTIVSKVEIVTQTPIVSSVVEVKSDDEPAIIIGNNIAEPEYDFLSRQPSEFVEETYKVINLKPSSKFHLKPRPSVDTKNKPSTKRPDSLHPVGLVTKLGGTVVKDGITTVHETSVIGTYISGKYAQVLQSTSHINNNNNNNKKPKINPSQSLRILKTAAPTLSKGKPYRHLEPTPAGSINEETSLPTDASLGQNSIKSTRKPSGSSFKSRFKNRPKEPEVNKDDNNENYKNKSQRTSSTRNSKPQNTSQRPQKFGRNSRKISTTTSRTVSVHSEEVTTPLTSFGNGKRYQPRRNKQSRVGSSSSSTSEPINNINNNGNSYSRRGYKPKVQTSTVEQISASTSLYKFKLNRSPGRWQYKTTPKPRVTIRKQNDDEQSGNETLGTTPITPEALQINEVVTPQARSDDVDGLEGSESIASIIDDENSTENKLDTPFPLETLKVEISTPPDFKDIYYEIATIKSPYTFQVGNVKNTRYITVTSTFEKSLVHTPEPTASLSATEPLTENILATSSNYGKDNNFLDSSIATLPPLYLASDMATPPLETLTETFSTTQTMLKTHVLPIVRSGNNETATSTLVQTYFITRMVTATKTLPPMEAYHFIPSKVLNEFNSHLDEAGSELHLELEFGDQNDQDEGNPKKAFPSDLDLSKIGSDFDLTDMDKAKIAAHLLTKKQQAAKPIEPSTSNLNPDQLQQLALLRLLNPAAAAAAHGQVITTSKPILKVETLFESHVIPITNGPNTILSTISKILGTVTKTDYEYGTSTIAPVLPQIPQVPIPPVNPLFPQVPQFTVTSSPILQTATVTQTESKVLKLTFGAKTAYTTIFSTKVVPTVTTSYMTASVPVQPTAAAFPGFFPAPYPAYPFVG